MQERIKHALVLLRKNTRFFFIIDGLAAFVLGIAIPNYLAVPVHLTGFTLGLTFILFTLTVPGVVAAYIAAVKEPNQAPTSHGRYQVESKWLILAVLAFTLAMITLVIIVLANSSILNSQTAVFAFLTLLLAAFLSLINLSTSLLRYKIFIEGVIIAILIPAFSLSFHLDATHPLLMLETIPLLLFYWACRVALEFELYAGDLKTLRQSFLIVIGWQRGITMHHVFLGLGFITIGLLPIYGISWSIIWPRLLILPLIFLQIWQLTRISGGQKPLWKLLIVSSNLLFLVYLYLVLLALWIN